MKRHQLDSADCQREQTSHHQPAVLDRLASSVTLGALFAELSVGRLRRCPANIRAGGDAGVLAQVLAHPAWVIVWRKSSGTRPQIEVIALGMRLPGHLCEGLALHPDPKLALFAYT